MKLQELFFHHLSQNRFLTDAAIQGIIVIFMEQVNNLMAEKDKALADSIKINEDLLEKLKDFEAPKESA